MPARDPDRAELLALLERARFAIEDSKEQWSAVPHLANKRRYHRQHDKALELLEAMRRNIESDDPSLWPS